MNAEDDTSQTNQPFCGRQPQVERVHPIKPCWNTQFRNADHTTQLLMHQQKSMTQWLQLKGHNVNIKRVRRLMDLMNLEAIYPRPRTTLRNPEHEVYPYLLCGVTIERGNQVWSTDIT